MASPREGDPMTYASTGVNYDAMDPVKKTAQLAALSTANNLQDLGFKEIAASRGESAHVIDMGPAVPFYLATVIEGLGTKNLVADRYRKGEPSFYDKAAQDTVAMGVNDILVVGARPLSVSAYWAAGSGEWFKDETRARELAQGWAAACNRAEAIYAGGETPTLKGIIDSNTVDLACSVTGIIQPKERLTLGDKLKSGDAIVLAKGTGLHANGYTLARSIAEQLPDGYDTKLDDGTTYGNALLEPTPIYAKLVRALFDSGIDIHYMANITGHGWRKLMRAERDFRYEITHLPEPQSVFRFIQNHSGNDNKEMYGNLNMGAGFAFFVAESDVQKAIEVGRSNDEELIKAGNVQEGKKEVYIKPLDLTLDPLDVRAA